MDESMYNLNIERSILSTIVFDPLVLEDAMMVIDENDFFLPAHRSIFAALVELDREKKAIDEEFLQLQLKRNKTWNEEVFSGVITANPLGNLTSYLEELKAYRQRRGLHYLSLNTSKALQSGKENEEIFNDISKTLDKISTHGTKVEPTIADIADEFEAMVKESQENGGAVAEKSGIDSLDRIIGGFVRGDLVVIGARPSMGKTVLATTITDNALSRGVGVVFDSLEMPAKKLFHRLMAKRSGETLDDLKNGRLRNYDNYRNALSFFKSQKNFYLQDESYIPIQKLKAKAIRHFRNDPTIGFWVIDHLRYIKKPGKSTHEEVGEITKELKKIAKEFNIVVVLLSQINREVNNRQGNRPQLTDLRDSGSIEEDADIVIMPHRNSYYTKGETGREDSVAATDLIIAKNRDGATGIAKTMIHFKHSKFEDGGGYEVAYESAPADHGENETIMELPPI